MDNSSFTPPRDPQIRPPVYLPSHKPVFLVFTLLILALLSLLYLVYTSLPKQKIPISPFTPTPPLQTPTLMPTTQTLENNERVIFYLKEGNVWSVKSDGTQMRQHTRDDVGSDDSFRYHSLVQKSAAEISYVRCASQTNQCSIISKNIKENEETLR